MRSKQSSDKRSGLVIVSLPAMKGLASLNKGVINLDRRERRREESEEWTQERKRRYGERSVKRRE